MSHFTHYRTADGAITSPGKFQGEPSWAPYFYALDEDVEFTDGTCVAYRAFKVMPEDRRRFPVLKDVFAVVLAETDDGFVTAHTFATDYELGIAIAIAECDIAAEECGA